MPKIRYLRTDEGIAQWYKEKPRLCWSSLVVWGCSEGLATIEDIAECQGCDYCGRVSYGDYSTIFSQQLRTNE